jgi:hypothetical protein
MLQIGAFFLLKEKGASKEIINQVVFGQWQGIIISIILIETELAQNKKFIKFLSYILLTGSLLFFIGFDIYILIK